MNQPTIAADVRSAVLALVRRAVGPAGSVIDLGGASTDDLEIRIEAAPPTRFALRPWDGVADPSGGPRDVWVIPRPNRAILQHLRDRGLNFIALNGAVRLIGGGLLVDRTDLRRGATRPEPSRRTDPFADRNSLVARTLLAHGRREWGVREIAAEAGVSLGTASQVVRSLTRLDAVRFERSGKSARVQVDDPARLVRRWVAAYTWERNDMVAFHAPVGDPTRFLRRLPGILAGRRWALTLQAGASLVAPHATWDRVHAYVGVASRTELLRIGDEQGWTAADDGALVLMKPYYKTGVWRDLEQIGTLPVVSALQLALDLWHYPLRGREQAEHLLSTRLHLDVS
jgi:hypothetical protein